MLEIWKYLLDDFLELDCGLGPEDRNLLTGLLAQEGLCQDSVEPVTGFACGKRWITAEKKIPAEVWFYSDGEIRSFRLVPSQKD